MKKLLTKNFEKLLKNRKKVGSEYKDFRRVGDYDNRHAGIYDQYGIAKSANNGYYFHG